MQSNPSSTDPLLIKYCDTFWNNFDAAVKQAEQTRYELKQFISLIQMRVKIETSYAEKLNQLSKVEIKLGRVGLTQDLINAYAASLKKKADQSKNFAFLLGQTGLDKLTHFYETLGAETKRLKEQGKGYQKQLAVIEEQYQKSLTRTDKRKKQLDELQLQFLVSATCRQLAQKKQSLRVKTKQKQKQYLQISKQCKAVYANYTKVRRTFQKSIRNILQTFYDYEKDKLDRMIDSFVNVQLIESSECKNRLVYLEEQSKFINSVNPETQIERFINSSMGLSQLTLLNKPSFKQSFLHFTFERLDSKKIEEVIKYGDTHKGSIKKLLQDPNSLSEQEVGNTSAQPLSIANYIRKMWQNTLCQEDNVVFDEQINNPLSRKDFVICLQQQRILGKFQIGPDKVESVVNTISRVLAKCYEQKDSYAAKQILVLIFTYFTNVKQGQTIKKQYLHSFLKSHQIWKSMQFWQSALIESLYEQSKGTQQVTTLSLKGIHVNNEKQQNLVFNQLAYYVYNMMLFDWQEKYVKQFASKFVKLYNLEEGLSKQVFDTIERARKSNETKVPAHEEVVEAPSVLNSLLKMFSQKESKEEVES